MKKIWLYFRLFNKRLLKKYIFIILLAMVPILVIAVKAASTQDSGVMHVLLMQEGGLAAGSESAEVISELIDTGGIIRYEIADDETAALEQVRGGSADCLWIFPQNLDNSIDEWIDHRSHRVIRIIMREDNPQNRLLREQLFGTLYPKLSYAFALDFMKKNAPYADKLSSSDFEEDFYSTYKKYSTESSIFSITYPDNSKYVNLKENYLTAPMRGFLALFVLICGMAAAMFFIKDNKDGIISWIPEGRAAYFPLVYVFTGVFDAAVFAFAGLALSGTFADPLRESAVMLIYAFSVTGFCTVLVQLIRNTVLFGAAIPVVIFVTLLLCPVLVDIVNLPLLQNLLPTYSYLSAAHSNEGLAAETLYALISCCIGLIIAKVNKYNNGKIIL